MPLSQVQGLSLHESFAVVLVVMVSACIVAVFTVDGVFIAAVCGPVLLHFCSVSIYAGEMRSAFKFYLVMGIAYQFIHDESVPFVIMSKQSTPW
jgi:hypothetical protein